MNREKIITKLFDRYGQDTVIEIKFKKHYDKAFVQLMRYKNKIYLDLPVGEIGTRDNSSYLYIGKPEYDFTNNWDTVRIFSDGYVHYVKRAQMVYCAGKPLYVWAVLYRTVRDGEYERL